MTYKFDEEFKKVLEGLPASTLQDVKKSRQHFEQLAQARNANIDTSGLTIEDKDVFVESCSQSVKVRLYIPQQLISQEKNTTHGDAKVSALVYVHGGGYVLGSLETDHAAAARYAKRLGIVVVSVDYRLAPENPFPAGLHDCYAALCWLYEQADSLSVDKNRIGIYGVSAGGGLSAAVTLLARDKSGPAICFQCLCIPELDDRMTTPSARQFVDTPIWDRAKGELSWTYYLGDDYSRGSENVPVLAAPGRESNFENLPPAYINTMEFDPLRDEGILYAMNLMAAGVPVELHNYPGTFHGSTQFVADVSKRQINELTDALRRGLKISS